MKSRIRCFFLEIQTLKRYSLRRYVSSASGEYCPGDGTVYHDAQVLLGDFEVEPQMPDYADPRWPTKCDRCGFAFRDHDEHQVFPDTLGKRGDTGELVTIGDAPEGAMWYADWLPWKGPDGHSLVVKLPAPGGGYRHEWCVDSRCGNCSMKDSDPDYTKHRCWVRTGTPPDVDVGKGGVTCDAGAGSIAVPGYHGFLRNGWLEEC